VRRAILAGLAGVTAALVFAGAPAHVGVAAAAASLSSASSSDVHEAAVVVDLGNGDVRSACVRFRQESITGLDLLRAAHMDPVVQTYSGQGGAVCKLCGVGCSAGSGCLTCQAPRYWQYWRSDGSSGTYTYSQTGAGNASVTDGDVNGWSWSADEHAPPFLTVAEACDGPNVYDYQPASTTTTTSTSTSSSTSRPTPATAPTASTTPGASARRPTATTSPVLLPTTTAATDPLASTSTSPSPSRPTGGTGGDERAAGLGANRTAGDQPSGSSPWPGLGAFAAVLTAIVAWTAHLRRRRRRTAGNMR
jgi:hypothetical protein